MSIDADTVRNNELLVAFGFRPTILGIPDEIQPCCFRECEGHAERTQFLEVNQAGPYDGMAIRLWLCVDHAERIEQETRPKPIAFQFFFPKLHMDSIPKEARSAARQNIERNITTYIEQHNLKRVGETEWSHQWGRIPDGKDGFIDGTMYTGTARVDRA